MSHQSKVQIMCQWASIAHDITWATPGQVAIWPECRPIIQPGGYVLVRFP